MRVYIGTALAQAKGLSLCWAKQLPSVDIGTNATTSCTLDLAALGLSAWPAAKILQLLSLVSPQRSRTSLLTAAGVSCPNISWPSAWFELYVTFPALFQAFLQVCRRIRLWHE